MTRHLDDLEMAAAVAGAELAAEAAEHLGRCLECGREVAALQRLIESRRAEMAAGEPDWEAARATVLDRIARSDGAPAAPQRVRWWRPLAAAAAMVLVAVAVVLLAPGGRGPAPDRTELQVDEILAEVDAVLDDDSIPGFEVIDPGVDSLEGYATNGSS